MRVRLRWETLVLVGLGVAWASRRPHRRVPSEIVYPKWDVPIRFSHARHLSFRGVSCLTCHRHGKRPKMAACRGCHRGAFVPPGYGRLGKRTPGRCRKCHLRFLPSGFPAPVRTPKARLRFSHRLHRAVACERCHRGMRRSRKLSRRHLPLMGDCVACHRQRGERTDCVACHERRAPGLLRTRYPEGLLVPGPESGSLDHGPDFLHRHGPVARARRRDCRACHEERDCLRCHAGRRRVLRVHPGNFRLHHGARARANPERCRACHTRQRFCLDCHTRLRVAQGTGGPYGGIARRFHPKGWASAASRSPSVNRHALEARRNISVCVSCHRESQCRRCHASRRVGGLGVSPHGPGFARSSRCRTLARRVGRTCRKCHRTADPRLLCGP